MSFAQRVIVDHAPLQSWPVMLEQDYGTMKSVILIRYLGFRRESRAYLGYIATIGCWYLPMLMVGVAKCPLHSSKGLGLQLVKLSWKCACTNLVYNVCEFSSFISSTQAFYNSLQVGNPWKWTTLELCYARSFAITQAQINDHETFRNVRYIASVRRWGCPLSGDPL